MSILEYENAINVLESIGSTQHLKKGTILDMNSVYYLKEGFCAFKLFTPEGAQQSHLFFKPHSLLNFVPSIKDNIYPHRTSAFHSYSYATQRMYTISQCEVIHVKGDIFLKAVMDNHTLQKFLLHFCAINLRMLLNLTESMGIMDAPSRIARVLFHFIPEEKPFVIPSILTYVEIVSHLSLHIMTVTKIFRVLMQKGIIVKKGSTKIVDNINELNAIAHGVHNIHY